jgi:ribosomal protein S18 acetylase RimI-like enzyme
MKPSHEVRRAGVEEAEAIGRMLHDFNSEYDDYTPGPEAMRKRIRELLESGDVLVLLGGAGPDGLALLRFRPSLWSESLDCYLEELYVRPEKRGQGLGQALMEAAMETAREEGAGYMDLGTADTDTAARGLYEKLGFSRTEGKPDGPVNYFYEREL